GAVAPPACSRPGSGRSGRAARPGTIAEASRLTPFGRMKKEEEPVIVGEGERRPPPLSTRKRPLYSNRRRRCRLVCGRGGFFVSRTGRGLGEHLGLSRRALRGGVGGGGGGQPSGPLRAAEAAGARGEAPRLVRLPLVPQRFAQALVGTAVSRACLERF